MSASDKAVIVKFLKDNSITAEAKNPTQVIEVKIDFLPSLK